ncbi:MAG: aminodeoxychorismate lyase [Proteobacteria bacterium]|nr:aminodeoxychorismate lyase [Pseudomonadota bacterium]
MTDWFANGKAVEHVPISDRGFQYGDGLFETIAIRNKEPRLWQFHMERLAAGCESLGISMPAETELATGLAHALQHSNASKDYCTAKIIVSAGTSVRGYGRTDAESPSILFGAFPSSPPPAETYRDGIKVVLCRTRLAVNSATAGLKTLNRLEQVLAQSEFSATGEFEGLTMDADGNIICGTMSNVFFVTDNEISTPPLDRCGVAGVMRRHIITTLLEQDLGVEIRSIQATELNNVDEVFLSNSQFGVVPVSGCMDTQWRVGAVTRRTMTIMADNGVAECQQ